MPGLKPKTFALKFLAFAALAFALSGNVFSQGPVEWQTLISKNKEFSITVPTRALVVAKNSRSNRISVVGGSNGLGFELAFDETSGAPNQVEGLMELPSIKGEKFLISIGDSRIFRNVRAGPAFYRERITVGTKDGYYSATIWTQDKNSQLLRSILQSISLEGQALLKDLQVGEPLAGASSFNVKDLDESDVVRSARKRKQTDKVEWKSVPRGYDPPEDEKVYSRPFLVVDRPHATYTDDARYNGVNGNVRLRIILKANGNVGNILVLKGLPFGLTEQSILAAKRIKFIPAEVNGAPVDAEIILDYGFNIY